MTKSFIPSGILITMLICHSSFAQKADPCGGPSKLLSLLNRPTVSDSACVVKLREAVLELGYQYLNLKGGASSQNYPEAELRIGLPCDNEFVIFLPNYNVQSISPHSGYNPTSVGIKHEIGYTEHWLFSIEGFITLATGGGGFGSNKYDPTLNALIEYSFNKSFSITSMLGIGTQTVPESAGGKRYSSFNPDFVFTWQVNDNVNLYGEIYGQTRTAPGEGAGFNMDVGILYLLTHYFEIDVAMGHRLSGNLEGYNNYYGVGLGILFD